MKIIRPTSANPLPKHAKKVFEGKIFSVYQWKQKMFDGSFATFEKVKRPDTVIVFPVLGNNKILLTRQKQPNTKEAFMGAAGGRVDPGEEVVDAAQRELLEETGYKAGKYILWKSLQPVLKVEWAVYVFIAKDLKKVADLNLDAGEKIELVEVTFDQFLQIASKKDFYEQEINREAVETVLNKKKKEELKKLLFGK